MGVCLVFRVEIQPTPTNLHNWVLACLIPNSNGTSVLVMVQSKILNPKTYAIEPQVKPTNKY
jgi:hypothetical protein